MRPIIKRAFVFNAHQLEGVPELNLKRDPSWDPLAEAQKLIEAANVPIVHGRLNKAYYSSSQDTIHLPTRDQFASKEHYYGTVLHELAHATGHESRLNRGLGKHPFGSPEYAREELRAEVASLMLSVHTGIPYDPSRHVPYKSWIKALSDNPQEIVLACRDADAIARYVISKGVEVKVRTEMVIEALAEPDQKVVDQPKRTYLNIPYDEKDLAKGIAKTLGFSIMWDRKEKAWFAPGGVDVEATPLAKWHNKTPTVQTSPQDEFATKLQAAGLLVTAPILDAKWHRAPVEGGKPGSTDGGYIGYLMATPHGFYQNFKTGEKGGWSYRREHTTLSTSDMAKLQEGAIAQKKAREEAIEQSYQAAALKAAALFANSQLATKHPYLTLKGVEPHGTRIAEDGSLLIPLMNTSGNLTSVQKISQTGEKRFLSGGKKSGSFYELRQQAETIRSDFFIIAEGFATAATIKEAFGETVRTICAFDAGNLKPVGLNVRADYPLAMIIFAADRDVPLQGREYGIGEEKAIEAARAVNGKVVTPDFGVHQGRGVASSDFNDLKQLYGLDMIRAQILRELPEIARQVPKMGTTILKSSSPEITKEQPLKASCGLPNRSLSLGLR